MKIVLITGATGYIGSQLTIGLLNKGWSVNIISRNSSNFSLLTQVKEDIVNHIHDGTMSGMNSILSNSKPDVVFHIASNTVINHSSEEVSPIIESNILFPTQLIEAMVSNNINRFINTGTFWQYYNNVPNNPVNLYAATKQAFETILHYYTSCNEMKSITLELYHTYGNNDPRPKIFNLIDKAFIEDSTLDMSPGDQLIDIVHIDDIVKAYIIAAERILSDTGKKKERFSLSSRNLISLKKLVGLYMEISGKNVKINWGGIDYREREIMIPWNRGVMLPKWEPSIQIIDGIKSMI